VLKHSEPDTSKVKTLLEMCILKDNTFQTDSIKHYAWEALALATSLDYPYGIGGAHRSLAIAHWGNGDLDSAMTESQLALTEFEVISDRERLASVVFLQGMILGDQGRYDQALENYYEALNYFEEIGNNGRCGIILNSMGLIQNEIGDNVQAEKSFLRSLEMLGEDGSALSKANSMSNLGDLYVDTGRLDEAYEIFLEVLEIDRALEIDWGIGFQLSNIGNVLLQKDEYSKALEYQFQALEIRRKLGHKIHLTSNLMMIGLTYLESGDAKSAIPYYTEAETIAKEIEARDYLRDILENLSRCHAKNGDFKKAYEFSIAATALNDSIFNKESSDKIQELTAQYENEKKEAEIALLSTENELKTSQLENDANVKKGLIGGIAFLALIGGLLFNGQRKKLRNQRLLASKNEEIQATEFKRNLTDLELKALRAQMNPHFIFNCMNSINRLILEDKNELASRNLTKFSKLIRMILDHSEKKTVKLSEELEMLETYIDLESQRFKEKISYNIYVSEDLDKDDIELPSMILQPFIENAIWHGLMHKEVEDGRIEIRITEDGDQLRCSIEDNGVGREKALEMKKTSAITHKSMAMKVTEARLALLDKTGLGKLIEIIDLKESGTAVGTRVELSIPI
jgi:tetratricopeptide (TPR) repeat protein